MFKSIGKAFKAVFKAIKSAFRNPYVRLAAGIAAGFYGGMGFAQALGYTLKDSALAYSVAAGASGGFIAGGIIGGNLESALYGALSGAAFGAIGGMNWGAPTKVFAHGLAGGTTARLRGGSFQSGMLSAGFAQWASPIVEGIAQGTQFLARAARVTASAVIGGTASAIGGGKFANGAVTGAFSRAFNEEVHARSLQDRADALAAEVSNRRYFTGKGEADWLYQINSDPNLAVTVDAARLNAEAIGRWVVDPNGGFRAPGYVTGDDYAVHGQVTLRLRSDGTYGVYDQRYDFELHADFTPRGFARNFGTVVGGPPGGFPNTPYWIRYSGNINVKNPYGSN